MPSTRASLAPLPALLLAMLAGGCGPTVFLGQTDIRVVGDLPLPPPPPKPAEGRAAIVDNKIVIKEKIQFEKNAARILPVSHGLLDEVVKVLQDNPHIKKVRVDGHASAEGPRQHNKTLSRLRARAVMKYLVDKGVDASRLEAEGFGVDQPLADNDTPEGREQNRRVEFTIREQTAPGDGTPIKEEP